MLDWLFSLIRQLFFMIDGIIYSFIGIVYNLLEDIAETSIFTEEVIDLFASKVYALLGIFMLFKVSFSILSYIVNPDDFLDKNKGFSKIISNIIITLVLLVMTPWIFTQAMDIQRLILRDNVIGKIFSTAEVNTSVVVDPGATMAYETFKAFYFLDTDLYPECEGLETDELEDVTECNAKAFDNDSNFDSMKQSLIYAYNTNNISIYMDNTLFNSKASDGEYTMNYMFLISTAAGIVVCLLLIVFCFDIALRSVKLGFLRMIAPIPIVSRIDPKKGKDVFDKWVKVCISTYLDLFVRLLAIYFAIFVITQLVDLRFVDAVTGLETDVNAFVKVFIILGALMFAKQLPKLIEDITGLKMSGKFTLNPLKKLGEVPLAGKAASLAVGGADSFIHGNGFMAGVKRNWKNVPLGGGDGKNSILETADRKMRREINEKRDMARQRYEGKRALKDASENFDYGQKSVNRQPELNENSTMADYQKAGFQNASFIESAMNVEKNKAKLKEQTEVVRHTASALQQQQNLLANLKSQLADAEASGDMARISNLTSKINTEESNLSRLRLDDDNANKTLETLQKVQKAYEDIHEKKRNVYTDDARLEDARKAYGKVGSPNPRPNP